MNSRWLLHTRNYGDMTTIFLKNVPRVCLLPPPPPPTVDLHHSELQGCTRTGPKEELYPQDFLIGLSTAPFIKLPAICLSFH